MAPPVYVLYLDAYHLDDPLYVSTMARMMARLKGALPPCLIVHGSGERAERLLEAEGLLPEKHDGRVQVRTVEEAVLVERAVRQVNRRVVGALTDEVVHAVGLQGVDRGLLRVDVDGRVTAGRLGWVEALVQQRVVPVVSALAGAEGGAGVREVALPEAVRAVAGALEGDAVVVFFTRTDAPGVVAGEVPLAEAPVEALPKGLLPEPEAVRTLVAAALPVLVTSAGGLFGGEFVQGTRVFASKTA